MIVLRGLCIKSLKLMHISVNDYDLNWWIGCFARSSFPKSIGFQVRAAALGESSVCNKAVKKLGNIPRCESQ